MSIYRNLYTGLGAGSVAAIIAVLISLPLESPDDIVFNAASVGLAALLVGATSGLLWHRSASEDRFNRPYLVTSAGLLIAVLVIAGLAQTQFDDAVIFTIPLAFIAGVVSIVGTPISATSVRIGNWTNTLLVVIAIALSLALAGQGDQESGSLSLPPPT
ncbi:MAG: hypothetical protein QF357_08950 [Dehalococcoidia bacterium]|jgi:hypothetical protein|nr:hypothetical protein [Dehalococcoidia bacterium]